MNTEMRQFAESDKTIFGFWVYIMSDCLLFASLFATYAVLHGNTYGGPGSGDIFSLPFVLAETLILLTSSFTAGLTMLSAHRGAMRQVLMRLGVTLVLGLAFLTLEVNEFVKFYIEGDSWMRSGFLSAFFTLVGTHGAHVAFGSLWMIVLMIQAARRGITEGLTTRLMCWSLFWHFLDIVWICIFSVVYLMGLL